MPVKRWRYAGTPPPRRRWVGTKKPPVVYTDIGTVGLVLTVGGGEISKPFGAFSVVLDDFNRFDEPGPTITKWSPWISPGLKILGNQLRPYDTGDNGGYFNTPMGGPDVEVYITNIWYPRDGGQILLAARLDPTTGGDGTFYMTTYSPYVEEAVPLTSQGTPTFGSGLCTIDTGDVITAPTSLINATQGWVAARVQPFWASTSGPTLARIFDCGSFMGYYDSPNGRWTLDDTGGICTLVNAHAANDHLTVIFAWTATQLKVSVNGSAFTTLTRTAIGSITDFSFGNRASDALRPFNGNFYWLMSGSGTLSDADAATLHANGDNDPPMGGGTSPGLPQLSWKANNLNYGRNPVTLTKCVAGTYTDIGKWYRTFSINDKIGLRCYGSVVESWIYTAGSWQLIGVAVDSAIPGTGNQNKFGFYQFGNVDAGAAYDDLNGGTLAAIVPLFDGVTVPLALTPRALEIWTPVGGPYSQLVISDGPSAYWRLDDPTVVANDIVGGNHGTYQGTYSHPTGAILSDSDTAVDLSSGGYVVVPYTPPLTGVAFTCEAWVKINPAGGLQVIYGGYKPSP